MKIPDYQTVMRPLLESCSDGSEHRIREIIDTLAAVFRLSADQCAELLPSGSSTIFGSRVGWARTYLKQAGLLEQPSRGIVRITHRGMEALRPGVKVDTAYLKQFAEFQAFQQRSRPAQGEGEDGSSKVGAIAGVPQLTPEEALQEAFHELRRALINDVRETLLRASPAFFERAVVDLLRAMGYGGSVEDSGTLLGGPGDGGVDGAIKEDQLGLDTIYVQAKRWALDRTVGDGEIRNFIGALQLHRARKGVFFTTSDFTKSARASASRSESRVVLINGTGRR